MIARASLPWPDPGEVGSLKQQMKNKGPAMKMRLFSTLISIFILSTAGSLAASYKMDLPAANIHYLIANQLDHVGGNSLANLFPFGTLPEFTQILIWNCSSYDAYQVDSGSSTGWSRVTDFSEVNPAAIFLNPGGGFFIVPAAPIIGLTFTGNPHPVQVPTPLPCGCGQFNFLSRQEFGTGTYENMTGLAPQNGAEFRRWNVATQSYDDFTFDNCHWSPSVPTVDGGQAAWILVPCPTGNPCPTNPCIITMTCSSNKTVSCGTNWDFDAPTNIVDNCCTNYSLSFTTVTNSFFCPLVFTRTWLISDTCGNTNTCTQTVTVTNQCVPGQTWTPHESNREWWCLASSADGSRLVAGTYPGQIYTSDNFGSSWTARPTGSHHWTMVACSDNGDNLVAVVSGGQIYTSMDSGENWAEHASTRGWSSVASSADGSKLVAVVYGGQIYTSGHFGGDWTAALDGIVQNWQTVASSKDGVNLVAAADGGQIYTSMDSGEHWTEQDSGVRNWIAVASSENGDKLVAVDNGGYDGGQIYTSADWGTTWTAHESNRHWWAVASSADGSKLVAVEWGGRIYTSTDSGVTWMPRESSRLWSAAASSADGSKLAAAANGGLIYTSACPPPNPVILGTHQDAGGMHVIIQTQPCYTYALECKQSLTDPTWNICQTATGDGANYEFIDPPPLPTARFYRVRLLCP
jgi:hypothetical protein